ncbi:glycosyltransferase family A protein [Acuticoccus sp.]|uniref:glycosyltransferase family A protein n=1 Tax=Acuticoccus sp. TaxID=1904378 RepID=UPI003B51A2EC
MAIPVVGLAMPVRNGEPFLERSISAILGQTHQDFVLHISDNCSDDRTAEICQDFAAGDKRISYHRQPTNIGAAGNFNFLAKRNVAPYFKWCAGDDYLELTYLERVLAQLTGQPEVVLAHSHTRVVNEAGATLEVFVPDFYTLGMSRLERVQNVLYRGFRCYEVFGLIRASALARTNLIGNHYAGDNSLMLELAMLGDFAIVPEPLFNLMRHPKQSVIRVRNSQDYNHWFRGRKKTLQFPDWAYLNACWNAHRVTALPLGERWRYYAEMASYSRSRSRALVSNLRVAAETVVFGQSDPMRRRLFSFGRPSTKT